MFLECVTVCKGFSDILEHTIVHNQALFDHWVIVTAHDDNDTHRVCKRHGIDCVDTDAFTRKGESFNKGLGVNTGLAHLTCQDWVLHLDADILLPPRTRHFLDNAELDTRDIYGIDRFNCVGWEAYQALKLKADPQYAWFCLINPPAGTEFGRRVVHFDFGGWMPIGFFQLWHPTGSGVSRYPVKATVNAEHTDVLHAMKWPRPRRVLLPEVLAVHLQSEKSGWGADWGRRTSKPFGPAPQAEAAFRRPDPPKPPEHRRPEPRPPWHPDPPKPYTP